MRLRRKLVYALATLAIPIALFIALLSQGWGAVDVPAQPRAAPYTFILDPKEGAAYWRWPALRSTQRLYRQLFIHPTEGRNHEPKAHHIAHR